MAPDWDTYERVCELFGWPRSFVDGVRRLPMPNVRDDSKLT